jgi:Cu+-exporting ATPase
VTASLAALDDSATAARFIERRDGDIVQAIFDVPDLHCASCLWLIERLWRIDPGIVRADVDLGRRQVLVTFRASVISLRGVAERLTAIGYRPLLERVSRGEEASTARRSLHMKIGVAGFAFGNAMLFSIPRYVNGGPLDREYQILFGALNLTLALPVLLYSASDYFRFAWAALRHRAVNLEVPVAIGLAALFGRTVFDIASGRGEGFADSFTGLVFFLLLGRLLQRRSFDRIAFDRTFRSFLPLAIHVERGDEGRLVPVPIDRLRTGDRICVRPGEVLPADAVLLDAGGTLDMSFLSGEATPVPVAQGDVVPAGARAVGAPLRLSVASVVEESRLAMLWRRPQAAQARPNDLTSLAAHFGRWFTIAALGLAAAGAIAWWPDGDMAVQVATAVLIIACPCALTLAAPMALGTAMSALGVRGIYLRDTGVMLALGAVDTVVFDKTGTLTSEIDTHAAAGTLGPAAWSLVRTLAAQSAHPVSRALVAPGAFDDGVAAGAMPNSVSVVEEVPGSGIRGIVDGHEVVIGAPHFVAAHAFAPPSIAATEGPAVAIDGRYVGTLPVSFTERPGMADAIHRLSRVCRTLLLSGDRPAGIERWRSIFGDAVWFRQSPEDKVARVRALGAEGHDVLMVGDGLNDAAALSTANVGLAVSDAVACVVPACDGVLAGRHIPHVPELLQFARRTRVVIVVCFIVSLLYNAVGLTLALLGALTPLVAAILMPVSSLTIVAISIGGTRALSRQVPA